MTANHRTIYSPYRLREYDSKAAEGITGCAVWSGSGCSWLSSLTCLRESHGFTSADCQRTVAIGLRGLFCPLQSQGKASQSKLLKSRVTCTEVWEVWRTVEVDVGNPARKLVAVGPPVAVRWAGCNLLFCRQPLGDERVPGEHVAPIEKCCILLLWQCKRLRSWWDVAADVMSLPATKQDGMEQATLQLPTYMAAHAASGSPLTRSFHHSKEATPFQ